MFKLIKDTRRRLVQGVLEKTGASEKTVDENTDTNYTKFVEMIDDMNECGAGLASCLVHQKKMFHDCFELSNSLSKIYTKHIIEKDHWPNMNCAMNHIKISQASFSAWNDLHEIFRSSSAFICNECALEPFRTFVTKVADGIGSMNSERLLKLTDFDAHRRRHKKLENKLHSSSGLTASEEADMNKFAAKSEASDAECNEITRSLNDTIFRAKAGDIVLQSASFLTPLTLHHEKYRA